MSLITRLSYLRAYIGFIVLLLAISACANSSSDMTHSSQDRPSLTQASYKNDDLNAAQKAYMARPNSIRIGKGDSLYTVSERYSVSLRALIETNHLDAPFLLNEGQSLSLPPPKRHRIRAGQTLMELADRYSIDYRSLAGINGLSPPYILKTGGILLLPSMVSDSQDRLKVHKSQTLPPTRQLLKLGGLPLLWPVSGAISSKFGVKWNKQRNDGINIMTQSGAPIHAIAAGQVIYAGNDLPALGELMLIDHGQKWLSAYAHAQSFTVAEGDRVERGDIIGYVGLSGAVDLPQLYFELRYNSAPVDPQHYLPKRDQRAIS